MGDDDVDRERGLDEHRPRHLDATDLDVRSEGLLSEADGIDRQARGLKRHQGLREGVAGVVRPVGEDDESREGNAGELFLGAHHGRAEIGGALRIGELGRAAEALRRLAETEEPKREPLFEGVEKLAALRTERFGDELSP